MAVPKKRSSRSVRDMRRSHHAVTFAAAVEACPSCGEPKLRHRLCDNCGSYRGRVIVAPAEKAAAPAPSDD